MIHKTRGIVLNHTRYGETSAIVQVFTLGLGMQSYMVNGVWGKKKGDKAMLLQPLNVLEMEVYYRSKRDIQRIKEFRLEFPLERIPYSQARRAQAFLITEVLAKVIRIEGANPELFAYLEDSIHFLDSDSQGLENFHLFFMFHLTRFLGFSPLNNHSARLPYFDLEDGCFVGNAPLHGYCLANEKVALFLRFFSFGQDQLSLLARSVAERRFLMETLLSLYEIQHHGTGRLKSLEVLGELFRE